MNAGELGKNVEGSRKKTQGKKTQHTRRQKAEILSKLNALKEEQQG